MNIFWVFGLLLLLGCKHVRVVSLVGDDYIPLDADCPLKMFHSPHPNNEYSEIGTLTVRDNSELDKFMPEIREQACRLGGDALLFMPARETRKWIVRTSNVYELVVLKHVDPQKPSEKSIP